MSVRWNLLKPHEWVGSFRHDAASSVLTGRLKYRPEDGVQLECFAPFDKYKETGDVLHGILEDGEPCTIYAKVDMANAGFSFKRGSAIHRGTWGVRYCVLGNHFDPEDLFEGFEAEFNNFQEFFFPKGHADSIPWAGSPIVNVEHDDLTIQIIQSGNFGFFGDRQVKALLHSQDAALKEELSNAIDSVLQNHKDKMAFFRKDLRCVLRVKSTEGMALNRVTEVINSLRLLFSLVMYRSVTPTELFVIAKDEEGNNHSLPFFCGFGGLNSVTINRFMEDVEHWSLPFNNSSIDISQAISRWMDFSSGYELFASKVANDDGWRSAYQTQTEFVLQLAQIEAIANELNLPHSTRYSAAIESCSGTQVLNRIHSLLKINSDEEVGSRLSDIRAEIAHFTKKKKYLASTNLFTICRLLDAVIAAHIFRRLGAEELQIAEFIKKVLKLTY